jgi:hypothetical protein
VHLDDSPTERAYRPAPAVAPQRCARLRGSLNPIERLWLHLRDNRLSHCVFQTTGEIVEACCEACNWLIGQTGRIQSLCSYPWLDRVSN